LAILEYGLKSKVQISIRTITGPNVSAEREET
jgi:hypothetical protein